MKELSINFAIWISKTCFDDQLLTLNYDKGFWEISFLPTNITLVGRKLSTLNLYIIFCKYYNIELQEGLEPINFANYIGDRNLIYSNGNFIYNKKHYSPSKLYSNFLEKPHKK